jgi:hypothetical protein
MQELRKETEKFEAKLAKVSVLLDAGPHQPWCLIGIQ